MGERIGKGPSKGEVRRRRYKNISLNACKRVESVVYGRQLGSAYYYDDDHCDFYFAYPFQGSV